MKIKFYFYLKIVKFFISKEESNNDEKSNPNQNNPDSNDDDEQSINITINMKRQKIKDIKVGKYFFDEETLTRAARQTRSCKEIY